MKNKGTRYDQDFKKMIVDLYNTKEHTYASLESEYGISAGTIQRWVKQFTPIQIDIDDSMSPAEIKDFRKEMAKLREENEILKKAMAILAKK
jgi:transposase